MMFFTRLQLFCLMMFLLIPESYTAASICEGDAEIFTKDVKTGAIPQGGKNAGKYLRVKSASDLASCIQKCCLTILDDCDVVFFHDGVCYWIKCDLSVVGGCRPKHTDGEKFNTTIFVTVRHVVYDKPADVDDTVVTGDGSTRECEYGLGQCSDTEECFIPDDSKARGGICKCKKGLVRSDQGTCSQPTPTTLYPLTEQSSKIANASPSPHSATVKVIKLTVSAGKNKQIQLPKNSVSLSAYVVPTATKDEVYHYTWSLVSSPNGAEDKGLMEKKNTDTVKLSHLIAGVYMFNIQVSGNNKLGETNVNVTVLPPARKNQPPVAIIKPKNQVIKLPNSGLLDGSDSTDDDDIVKYHWEEVNGPLQEHKASGDASMLKLENFPPGNYTFKLTVTDSDGSINSTSANVTINKETDYPPKANAGSDIVIHLPQKSAILYGNASTDDKGIVSYEWTKTSDNKVTQDVSGVRTPFLHLNNLEVGDYTYTLKVTDSSGQSSSADVHVFVKLENNQSPVAVTANNLVVVLPAGNIVLDGSNSTDDNNILQYLWKQTSGPTTLEVMNGDRMVASAKGTLKQGLYTFELMVKDIDDKKNVATLTVTAKKNANLAPIANAGGDKEVCLPISTVSLDGGKSTDDHGIIQYQWNRGQSSLAAGDSINGSANHVVLQLVNLVAGRYVFSLTVFDSEGLTSSDSASITVKEDPNKINMLELILDTDVHEFTEENKDRLASQLKLLLHKDMVDDDTVVQIQQIAKDLSSRYLHVRFLVKVKHKESTEIANGVDIRAILKHKLHQNSDILDFKVISIDTLVCQNNCSGHGHCELKTKMCICDAFWMQNFISASIFLQESNCDWSIIYVVIVSFVLVITLTGGFWLVICLCRSKNCNFFRCKLKSRKRHRYSLLNTREEDVQEMKEHRDLIPKGKIQNSSVMLSESDFSSEEETLFINSKKTNGHIPKPLNGVKPHYKSKLRT